MATQTKVRAGSAARQAQRASATNETLSLTERIRSVGRGFSSVLPAVVVSDRLRREITSVVMLLLTILSAWVLGSRNAEGTLVVWWGDALRAVCGQGAFLVPVMTFGIAYRAFRINDTPVLLPRHYLGGAGFGLAIVGLFELAAEHNTSSDGGRLGLAVATLLSGALGQVGSAVLLLVAGGFGVFLLANTDILELYREVRKLIPESIEDDINELVLEPVAMVVADPPTKGRRAARATATVSADDLGLEPAEPPVPPAPRVINVPKVEKVSATPTKPVTIAPVGPGEPMPLPEINRLAYYESVTLDTNDLEAKARLIEATLSSFKVEARVREINPGPAVTQYTLEPGVGIKVRRITELQNDLALALAAPSIRIEAPVPGMARVGLEIPNAQVATVGLRETLESPGMLRSKAKLPVPLGRDVNGKYIIHDLTKMPHLLIAGATGAGKSVGLNAIISTFLLTRGPDELKMVMIDPKMVELVGYNGVPHLQCPVVTEMDKVVGALRLVVQEMQRRYDLFAKNAVRNIDGYRLKITDEPNAERIPYLVVILDELADLMMTSPDEVETLLCRLTQMGRAAGIHMIIATQRPSVDVLTGLIKANVPARIAFAVTSLTDSRVVLDMPGAERLLGRGDMLFMPPDAAKPQRIQGAFIEDNDVHYIVGHWHAVSPIPQYAKEWLELPSSNAGEEDGEDDPLMIKALEIVKEQGTASASMLQRRLRIGYNRAARLIEQMEDEGLVGPADGIKGRPFLGGEDY